MWKPCCSFHKGIDFRDWTAINLPARNLYVDKLENQVCPVVTETEKGLTLRTSLVCKITETFARKEKLGFDAHILKKNIGVIFPFNWDINPRKLAPTPNLKPLSHSSTYFLVSPTENISQQIYFLVQNRTNSKRKHCIEEKCDGGGEKPLTTTAK